MLTLFLVATSHAAEVTHLTVDAALAALEAQNPSLLRAEAQVDAAQAGSLLTVSAILPTVTAAGNYTRNNAEATLDLTELFDAIGDVAELTGGTRPEAPDPFVLQPLESVSGSASVRVPLIAPAAWASIHGGRLGVDAAEANLDAARSSLRASAIQAFWSAGAAEAFLTAQVASVERARELVRTAEVSLRAGSSTRLDLLQAQTELARREGDLLQARANLEKARVAIGALLGGTEPVVVDLPAPVAPAPADGEAALQEAWSTRGEVRAAQAQVDAVRAQLLAARLAALPTLSGSFSASAASEAYPTGDKTAWKATLDLTWPILQGGQRAGNEDKAQAALADAEAALAGARVQVAQQVHNAVADQSVAAARLDVAVRQRALADEAARVAQLSYDEGVTDARTVLDALDRLDQARASEIDAQARLGVAEAAMRAAVGRW